MCVCVCVCGCEYVRERMGMDLGLNRPCPIHLCSLLIRSLDPRLENIYPLLFDLL